MKRFFCPICKRIKRVQKFPANIQNQYSDNPTDRIGVCLRHSMHPDYYKLIRAFQEVK